MNLHAGNPAPCAALASTRARRRFDRNPQEEKMRIPMIVATAMLLTVGAGNVSAAPVPDTPLLVTASLQQTPPPQQPNSQVKVDVNLDEGRTVWYTDPLWIVLGAAAVIVVVALIAAAARGGGGTTVVR